MSRHPAPLICLGLISLAAGTGMAQEPPIPPPAEAVAESIRAFLEGRPGSFDQAEAFGLAGAAQPVATTWRQFYDLALVRARSEAPPRFESLDPAALDRQARDLGRDDFARFRDDLGKSGKLLDPAPQVLGLLAKLLAAEGARRDLSNNERWNAIVAELMQGDTPGVGESDREFSDVSLESARRRLDHAVVEAHDRLDALKEALGLAPGAAVVVGLGPVEAFRAAFAAEDRWCFAPNRDPADLERIARGLPEPGDLVVAGRPLLAASEDDPARQAEARELVARLARARPRAEGESADTLEFRALRRLRHAARARLDYRADVRRGLMACRRLDSTLERIVAPPEGTTGSRASALVGPLIQHSFEIASNRDRVVGRWVELQVELHGLRRELGLLPDDWAGLFGQLDARPGPQPAGAPFAAGDAPSPPPDR